MKYYLTLIVMAFALNLAAQKPDAQSTGYAIIKGHIENNTDDFLDIGCDKLLGYETVSIIIDKHGDFSKKIKIENNGLDVLLGLSTIIPLYVQNRDTIYLNWDAKDVEQTFKISASKKERTEELQTMVNLRKVYIRQFYDLEVWLGTNKVSDSTQFNKINDLYNKEIEALLEGNVYNTSKMAADIYFRYADILLRVKLLPRYDLFLKNPTEKSRRVRFLNQAKPYQEESEELYKTSPDYRRFIFNYVRFYTPFRSWSASGSSVEVKKKELPFSPARANYYSGLSSFNIIEIRDWFITKSIMNDFEDYSFEDAVAVYKNFITKVQTPFYADTLKIFYANVQRVKPGSPAPVFKLKDELGKSISLADFKGKTIYMDFWGVNCGPCISDIKNNIPALHEKYTGKDIVFINICVDADVKEWKENLKKLDLKGVNLIAEGWTKNPVNKAYGINGIPHYYLIDKAGKIVNNNSPGPNQKSILYTQLDKLLK